MKLHLLTASLAVASLFFTSCKKESTNTEQAATIMYRLQTTNRTAVVARTSPTGRVEGANIQWQSGSAAATGLKFEATNSAGEVELKQKIIQQLDLFATNSVIGNMAIPAGTYNEVELKAYLAPVGSSPALELNGSFTNGSSIIPVRFIVNTSVELKAEKHSISVAEGNVYSALNTLDLSALTNGIAESALASATLANGVIVLSASSNAAIYNRILENLQRHHGEAEIEHH